MDLKNLLQDIEHCREEMVQLASYNPLSCQEVIDASIRLDQLLNMYYSIDKNSCYTSK